MNPMKCPECGVDLADDMLEAGLCFECGCTFPAMKSNATLLREKEEALAKARAEEQRKREEDRKRRELEEKRLMELAEKEEKERIAKEWKAAHPDADGKYYQYKTVVVQDKRMGQVNAPEIERVLNEMGYDGWRLVSTFTNEVGKNAGAVGVGDMLLGLNATMDETVLVFERVVRV